MATEELIRRRCESCGKAIYKGWASAHRAVRELQRRREKKSRLHPYVCPAGNGFHVGHIKDDQ